MLKNRYQEILVGLNLMSLIRGLISMRRKRSTLLIDDKRFESETYPGSFLSELEVLALLRLGKRFEIPELSDIRQFLVPATMNFISNETRLRLGQSPFKNLIELLRKYPELLDSSDLDLVYSSGEKEFNRYFFEEMIRFENLSFETSSRPKGIRFELQGPKWFKTIYQRFQGFINQEYSQSKDLKYAALLHLMGISFEEKLKTRLGPEEIPFYFFRLLSPLWRLQDFFLMTQLKRRLLLLGGDFKESSIQFWQLYEGKFENLLLASFEGVISGQRVLFFSHPPEDVPFSISSPYPFYRKTQMTQSRRSTAFPPTEMSYITDIPLLGSERPYRAVATNSELVFYHWPYPELPGSKAEFYDRQLLDSFQQDSLNIPFEKTGVSPQGSLAVSLDLRQLRDERKTEATVLMKLPLSISENEQVVSGFEYWGTFRYRSFGLLALCYGVEGI